MLSNINRVWYLGDAVMQTICYYIVRYPRQCSSAYLCGSTLMSFLCYKQANKTPESWRVKTNVKFFKDTVDYFIQLIIGFTY